MFINIYTHTYVYTHIHTQRFIVTLNYFGLKANFSTMTSTIKMLRMSMNL